MTTRLKPDLVKLNASSPMRTVKKWVVVINAGMYDQEEVAEFSSYDAATRHCAMLAADYDEEAQIMKRLPNKNLTCEF